MRTFWLGMALIGLINLAGVLRWHYDEGITHPENFENLDTRTIVARLEQPHSVWRWFTGDWVLGNGFYRPLPSLLYKLDYTLWGRDFLAYKWTNGVLALLCGWLVVGLAWQLSGRLRLALGTGAIFSLWQTGFLPGVPEWLSWVWLAGSVAWGWCLGDWRKGVLVGTLGATALWELGFIPSLPDLHMESFAYRAVGWIPGRTATLMTLFALMSLIAFCRYALTRHIGWAILSLLGLLGALGSHEGAVILPLLMALCAVVLKRRGAMFPAWLLAVSFAILLAYVAFYQHAIPINTEYHRQRLKRFDTMDLTWLKWLFPPAVPMRDQLLLLVDAPLAVFLPGFWESVLCMGSYGLALAWLLRQERLTAVGWLGSLIAYMPLSPVLPLMHYYYLPAAFRAFLIACLLSGLVRVAHRFSQALVACPPEPAIKERRYQQQVEPE